MIRPVKPQDVAALCAIYNHYVIHTVVSFEEEPITAADFAARIAKVQQAGLPYLVAEESGEVVGHAYASRWKERSAYRFCAEASVYLAPACIGKGQGTALYEALFAELRKTPMRVVIGGIALPNPASVALHEKLGMRKVSHYPQVGYKFGQWIDVGYWQVELRPPV
jgi:L-amino acid N-acyltransferase YncA